MDLQVVVDAHHIQRGHSEGWQRTWTTCKVLCQKFKINPELPLTHVSPQGKGWRARVNRGPNNQSFSAWTSSSSKAQTKQDFLPICSLFDSLDLVSKNPLIAYKTAVWANLSDKYPSTKFLRDLLSIDSNLGPGLHVVVFAWAAWWYARPGPHADAVANVLSASATFPATPENPPAPQPLPQALQPPPMHVQPQPQLQPQLSHKATLSNLQALPPQQQPHLPSGGRQQQTQAAEAEQSAAADQARTVGSRSSSLSAAQDGGAQSWGQGRKKKQRCDNTSRNGSACTTYDLTHVPQSLACGAQFSGRRQVPGPSSASHELGGASAGSTLRSDQTDVPSSQPSTSNQSPSFECFPDSHHDSLASSSRRQPDLTTYSAGSYPRAHCDSQGQQDRVVHEEELPAYAKIFHQIITTVPARDVPPLIEALKKRQSMPIRLPWTSSYPNQMYDQLAPHARQMYALIMSTLPAQDVPLLLEALKKVQAMPIMSSLMPSYCTTQAGLVNVPSQSPDSSTHIRDHQFLEAPSDSYSAGCAGADASMAAQSPSATLEVIPTPLLSPSCNVYGGHAQERQAVPIEATWVPSLHTDPRGVVGALAQSVYAGSRMQDQSLHQAPSDSSSAGYASADAGMAAQSTSLISGAAETALPPAPSYSPYADDYHAQVEPEMGSPVSSPITFTASGSVDGTNDLLAVLTAAATPLSDEPGWFQFEDAEAHMGCVLFHFQTSTTNVTHQACLLRRLHHNFLKQFGQEVSFNITVMLSGCVMQISKSKGSAPVVYTLTGVQRPVIISHCMESGKLIVTGACLDGTTFHAAQYQQPAVERLVVLESSKRTAEQNPGSCLSGNAATSPEVSQPWSVSLHDVPSIVEMEELLCQALKHEISPLPSTCDTVVLQRPRMLDNQGGRVRLQAVRNGCFSDYQPIALHKLAEQDSQPFNSDKLGSPVTIQDEQDLCSTAESQREASASSGLGQAELGLAHEVQPPHLPVDLAIHEQELTGHGNAANAGVLHAPQDESDLLYEEAQGCVPEDWLVSSDSNDCDPDDNGYVHVSAPRLENYSNQNGADVSALGSPGLGMPWQCTGQGQDTEQGLLLAAQQGIGPFPNALDPQPYSNHQQQQPGVTEPRLQADLANGNHNSDTIMDHQDATNPLAFQQQPGGDPCTHQQGCDCAPVPAALRFDLQPGPHQQQASRSSGDSSLRHGMQPGKRSWQAEPGVLGPDTQNGMVAFDVMYSQANFSGSGVIMPQARRQRTDVPDQGSSDWQRDSGLPLTEAKIRDALMLEASSGNSGLQVLLEHMPDLGADVYVGKELEHAYEAFTRALIAQPDQAARSALALGAARLLKRWGLEGLNYVAFNFRTLKPPVPVFIDVLDLLKATGQNPHTTPYTVIEKIWKRSHPESFAFASKQWGSKPQPYSQHLAQTLAEPVYPFTGKSKAEHVARANELKLERRADRVIDEVEALHKQIAKLSLKDHEPDPHKRGTLRSALRDDIRSLYQIPHGSYNKPQSIEVFQLVAQHPGFWPDADTHDIMTAEPVLQPSAVLKRDFSISSPNTMSSISLHVSGSPDFTWPSGVVKLKNRMYAEDEMLDKWRLGEHAESCVYHILSAAYPKLRQAKYRYMVEHMRVGTEPYLTVHCRDEVFCRTGGRQFIVKEIPPGAAGTMVITRYSMQQSLQLWETEFVPHLERFCRVLARLFYERSYQRLFMTSENQEQWFAEWAEYA